MLLGLSWRSREFWVTSKHTLWCYPQRHGVQNSACKQDTVFPAYIRHKDWPILRQWAAWVKDTHRPPALGVVGTSNEAFKMTPIPFDIWEGVLGRSALSKKRGTFKPPSTAPAYKVAFAKVGQLAENPPARQQSWVRSLVRKMPWESKKPTPVFLPGESHGQRILAG